MLRLPKFVIIISFLVMIGTPGLTQAGWFTDAYLGNSFTGDATLEVELPYLSEDQDVNFDGAATFGTRVGYWFDKSPFVGVALDLSGVSLEVETLDYRGTYLSPMVFFRFKIKPSEVYPYGQFQPYFAFGPSIVFSQFDAEVGDLIVGPGGARNSEDVFSAQSTDLGFDTRLGLRYHFAWNFSVFGEYRFTYVESGYSDNIGGFPIDVNSKFQTNHFLIGVGWGF